MSARKPPKSAMWLLRTLGSGPHLESLIGDLQEQLAHDRSSAWYWRQVGVAIARSCVRFARVHGISFVVAFAAAWAVMALSFWANELVWDSTHAFAQSHRDIMRRVHPLTWLKAVFILSTVVRVALFVLAGWLLARIHRAHQVQAVMLLLITALFWRFVPQRIAMVYDPWTHMFLHLVSAIGGLLIGALILGRPRKPSQLTAS